MSRRYKIIVKEENGKRPKIQVTKSGKIEEYFPEEIICLILRKLLRLTESYLNETIKKVAIIVPAYFNDSQRNSTFQAGKLTRLNVLIVINKPTAAAIGYGLDNKILNINNKKSFEEQ